MVFGLRRNRDGVRGILKLSRGFCRLAPAFARHPVEVRFEVHHSLRELVLALEDSLHAFTPGTRWAAWVHPPLETLCYTQKSRDLAVDYVEKKKGTYRIRGSRVSLESTVYAFLNGQTAESIAQSFPTLDLEQVYGAIAYYLSRREEIDAYLSQMRSDYEAKREQGRRSDPMFYQKLVDARLSKANRT
jgi:uncharacterized protein (DUF433 family)